MAKKKKNKKDISKSNTKELGVISDSSMKYVLLLLFVSLLPFLKFIFSGDILIESDVMNIMDGRIMLLDQFKIFHLPLWHPERLSGMPTVDALFGDIFYPANFLLLIMPIYKALGYKVIIHVFLAGLFFFFLLSKHYRFDKTVSVFGAILYMLNAQFISHTYPGHEGKMFVIALLPFVFWMLERLIQKATLWRSSLLGIGVALSLLTSHIQMTYFMLWGLFTYVLFRTVIMWKEDGKSKALRVFGFFWIGIFIGLGLGMIQLLPPFMYVKEGMSVRGASKGIEYATSWSMHAEEVASLIVPEFGNSLEHYWGSNYFKLNTEYVGLVANLLFVFSLIVLFDRKNIYWLGVALFSLLYSLGAHTPLWKLCYYVVPGVKSFRGPSMILFWFSFSLVLVGIRGLSSFINESPKWSLAKKEKFKKNILISIGVIGGICLLMTVLQDAVMSIWTGIFQSDMDIKKSQIMTANYKEFIKGLWLFGIFTSISLYSIVLYINGSIKRNVLIGVLILIGFVDLWRVDSKFIKTEDPSMYLYPDAAINRVMQDGEVKRVFELPGAYGQNHVGRFGLESVVGFHDNELKWYRKFRGERSENFFYGITGGDVSVNPFLNLLNVKYLFYRQNRGQPVQVIQNRGYIKRAFLCGKYEVVPESLVVNKLKDSTFDYRNTVLLEKTLPDTFANRCDSIGNLGTAEYRRISPNKFVISVNANRKCMLAVSEVYYPGWQVTVDGKKDKVYKAYGTLMALPVIAGHHEIIFTMHSKYLNIGALITLFSLIVVIIIGGVKIRTGKLLKVENEKR